MTRLRASTSPSSAADPRPRRRGDDLLQRLLVETSRTFALCVPELPEPDRRRVTVAYLLFRIADTFEDATVRWSRARRLAALDELVDLLAHPRRERAAHLAERWTSEPPCDHAGYLELLARTPEVFAALDELAPEARSVITRHTVRTSRRMATFVAETGDDGELRLESLPRLREYCYAVAGIVGELLTELFLIDRPELEAVADALGERASAFGEGLQLVNILKDSADDASEGRTFLPPGIDRDEVFALARRDLEAAAEYCLAIQRAGGPDGIVAFTALPVELARATLDKVERSGPGSKITRTRVFRLHRRVHRAIAAGRPVLALAGG